MTKLLIESFKGRKLAINDSVQMYRNLHKDSLTLKKQGLVHGHAQVAELQDVSFAVSLSGNKRTRLKKQKNVHAFVKGILKSSNTVINNVLDYYTKLEEDGFTRVYYNPHVVETFVVHKTSEPVFKADKAIVVMDRVYIKNN